MPWAPCRTLPYLPYWQPVLSVHHPGRPCWALLSMCSTSPYPPTSWSPSNWRIMYYRLPSQYRDNRIILCSCKVKDNLLQIATAMAIWQGDFGWGWASALYPSLGRQARGLLIMGDDEWGATCFVSSCLDSYLGPTWWDQNFTIYLCSFCIFHVRDQIFTVLLMWNIHPVIFSSLLFLFVLSFSGAFRHVVLNDIAPHVNLWKCLKNPPMFFICFLFVCNVYIILATNTKVNNSTRWQKQMS